ncbi:MAG: DUF2497 domain-containing protein [Alphaproteobacteria bacterium]|nr:DUF2497 domain-containing protein [Alphaproteobacteria bacterium]MCL2505586.1 DUF2497 domain-containing protein [Alphaproteobacteria bacterium]
MANQQNTSEDPTMEEILASIRKIISDDEAKDSSQPDDVIELTEEIKEDFTDSFDTVPQTDTSAMDFPASPAPSAPPPPPKPEIPAAPVVPPVPEPDPFSSVSSPLDNDVPLVSSPVVDSAASTLSSFANTIELERLSSAGTFGASIGNGQRTLEDMVVEAMRPILKSWLEANLSSIVERLVQKEIDRISRRT